jgi:glycosyltransferase involved in cell wall biosynthesis
MDISVIICCYNSENRILRCLKYLSNQIIDNVICEIILVDNNCSDNTVYIAKQSWLKFGSPFNLTVVEEKRPGLSYAREKGVKNSKGDLVLFCDDDNLLSDKYLLNAYEMYKKQINFGALGGWCNELLTITPPSWFNNQKGYFAISRQGIQSGDITLQKGTLYGAGIITKRAIFNQLYASSPPILMTGRKGKLLSSGEDTEYCYLLRLMGYRLFYDENLYFEHAIPNERLNYKYLIRLRLGILFSTIKIQPYLWILNNNKPLRRGLFLTSCKMIKKLKSTTTKFNLLFIIEITLIIIKIFAEQYYYFKNKKNFSKITNWQERL